VAEKKAWKEKRRQENIKRVKTTGLDWAGDAISNEGRKVDKSRYDATKPSCLVQ